jgi:hypothetical protein
MACEVSSVPVLGETIHWIVSWSSSIADDHAGPASPLDESRELPGHAVAGNRGFGDGREALVGDVIDDIQYPEPSAIGHLVMDEVQRPPGIRPCLHKDGRPHASAPLAALALAYPQTLLPVEPVDAVDARCLALPPQQDEQPSVAEPSALIGKVSQPLPELRLRRPP